MTEFGNTQDDLYLGSTIEEIYENDPELSLDNALENTVTMELLEDVLHDYWEGIAADSNEIEELSKSDDYKLYTVKVHALKSSSRIVGIMKLGDMAYELEMAGKAALPAEIAYRTGDDGHPVAPCSQSAGKLNMPRPPGLPGSNKRLVNQQNMHITIP